MWSGAACLLLSLIVVTICLTEKAAVDFSEDGAIKFLERISKESSQISRRSADANWAYESNITDHNLERKLDASKTAAEFSRRIWEEVISFPWKSYKDESIKRQFQKLSFLGDAALPPEKYEENEKIKASMSAIFAKATVCDFNDKAKCDLHLEPEIVDRMATSEDPKELEHYWVSWRNQVGRRVRSLYKEYANYANDIAKRNNFTDAAALWTKDYEASDFDSQIEELWIQVEPMYKQLHAYVRRKLREKYGEGVVTKTGPIPAHLLGNMWAQTWENVEDFTKPFPNRLSLNVTPSLIEQNYTPNKIFKLAEEFFTSINLTAMPASFWTNSILEKPKDGRDLVCHASAWDFYDGQEFRIKQCTEVNSNHLETAHHEMGHIEYFLQYRHLPVVFREGANPGFHEAVGDVISLSVSTPSHLHKIKLLKEITSDPEADINHLFQVALNKIAFLPFGYLMDQYRWSIFRGQTSYDDLNCRWWQLRNRYQGVQPPVDRTEEDFDPASKYHIVGDVPYIRYFVSFVTQFQFHKALCERAGQYDGDRRDGRLLHACDIHGSVEAGNLLKNMLKLGGSKPWPDAMEAITGQSKMDANAILHYFRPLTEWLEAENAKTGEYIGWTEPTKVCKTSASPAA